MNVRDGDVASAADVYSHRASECHGATVDQRVVGVLHHHRGASGMTHVQATQLNPLRPCMQKRPLVSQFSFFRTVSSLSWQMDSCRMRKLRKKTACAPETLMTVWSFEAVTFAKPSAKHAFCV